jgi:hypothetical protein
MSRLRDLKHEIHVYIPNGIMLRLILNEYAIVLSLIPLSI